MVIAGLVKVCDHVAFSAGGNTTGSDLAIMHPGSSLAVSVGVSSSNLYERPFERMHS